MSDGFITLIVLKLLFTLISVSSFVLSVSKAPGGKRWPNVGEADESSILKSTIALLESI